MKSILLGLAILQAALIQAATRTASIFTQPVALSDTTPALLAEVEYDLEEPSSSPEILSYEAPDLPEDAKLVRIGVYDGSSKRWLSSTSVLSVTNFGKGYSPHLTIDIDSHGNYIGVSCKGVRIDAGHTRDFGPQAAVLVTAPGKQPELNKPILLSPEGRKVEPEEKSFLQKYWWALAIGMFLLMSGGSGPEK